eukprot:scaffold2708_cov119-Cylindrotheca_fusiformis.AAC.3
MSSPRPPDRSSKRLKGDGGPPPPDGYGYGPQPSQGRYQQPPYGPGGPSMGPQSGYMWQHGQYPNSQPPPPHSWGHGSPHPGTMHGQRGGPAMTPDRVAYTSAYPRGPPPSLPGSRRGGKPGPPSRQPPKTADASSGPQSGFPGGWGPSQGSQWPQYQYGGGTPTGWQGAGPPMHQPPGYGNPAVYGASTSPPRVGAPGRPRSNPEILGGYPPGPPSSICQPVDNSDIDMYHSRGVGPPHDDDGNSSTGNRDSKDKGRGSYKCGRCGVPKKGHVCPYQPKLSRRPGEPLPEMRSAAIQVEMDEGFPESYATEPYMDDDMVVGEPANPHAVPSGSSPNDPSRGDLMTDSSRPTIGLQSTQDHVSLLGSPIRSSPISDDPIVA